MPEKSELYNCKLYRFLRLPMEGGTSPDKLQSEKWSSIKEVKFAIQDGIAPTIPVPDTCNELNDLSSPIDDGSSWEK